MSKQFWGIIAAIIIVFAAFFALNGNKSDNSSGKSGSSGATQHVIGKGNSGVTLIEYGDYQCPFCEQYYPIVKQVQAEFNDQVSFQFRNYPLTNLHPNAFAAARAAEAAGLQNKFWEMHDMLYEPANWQVWTAASDPTKQFSQYAQQLSLDVTKFKSDFASTKVNDLVNADMAAGNKLGITGTPSFYLDGKHVEVGATADAFEKLIKAEIAKKAPSAATSTQQ